jgi:hypothetical protein
VKAQLDLDYSPRDKGHRSWERVLRVVRLAIDRLTLKEVAFLLDTSPSMLADALAERDRKRFAAEWLVILITASPEPVRGELVAELNRCGDYRPPQRAKQLTPEEELRITRKALARIAPGLLPTIDAELEDA